MVLSVAFVDYNIDFSDSMNVVTFIIVSILYIIKRTTLSMRGMNSAMRETAV